ncbi:MAG: hypothetical protein NXI17_16365 [Alphaproteobacteria bacterium]|nr:hypothetical protein [Alphaproteobacteria bacterium]
MQLKRLDDSRENAKIADGDNSRLVIDTSVSEEILQKLKLIDANIKTAEQKSGTLLVG